MGLRLFYVLCCAQIFSSVNSISSNTFTVDYAKGTFLKDGRPFHYVSGSIHYSRVHPDLWYDRLYKMKYAGLDAIQVYIPWNYHETEHGVFDFSGGRDVEKFIQMAHDLRLLVILRPGPYICAEWEFGGFPYWLLKKNASMALRTSDPEYLKYVTDWYTVFLPKMRRFLYSNGGPIISVQIENEYGDFKVCDYKYMEYLLSLSKSLLVDDVVYFTLNGNSMSGLKCGTINDALTTVDFGTGNFAKKFEILNEFNSSFAGPYVNTEYYIGWLDLWGKAHSHVGAWTAAEGIKQALQMKANVNMYMFYGGTNFGFTSGATGDKPIYRPVPTSYDYDAAISEAGDMTHKYQIIRKTILQNKDRSHTSIKKMAAPVNSTKMAYGKVEASLLTPVTYCARLMSELGQLRQFKSDYPVRMELLNQSSGYTLYSHVLQSDSPQTILSVPGIRDRGYVLLNNMYYGILYRDGPTNLLINGYRGDQLDILVENMGRINYSPAMLKNTKGIISNVTLGDRENVTGWSMIPIKFDMTQLTHCHNQRLIHLDPVDKGFVPSVYAAKLNITKVADTFIRLDGWFKGHVVVNQFNIGRYWPVKGPQNTLYVPSAVLKLGYNVITVTELESSPCSRNKDNQCYIEFVDVPEINAEVHPLVSVW